MKKGDLDLKKLLSKSKPLEFKELYVLFKDTIFGLVYLSLINLSHRDIKPNNIMRIGDHFNLMDYGLGINLSFEKA